MTSLEKVTKEWLTKEILHSAEVYLSTLSKEIIKDDDPIGSYCNLAYYVYLDACSRLLPRKPHHPYGVWFDKLLVNNKFRDAINKAR